MEGERQLRLFVFVLWDSLVNFVGCTSLQEVLLVLASSSVCFWHEAAVVVALAQSSEQELYN